MPLLVACCFLLATFWTNSATSPSAAFDYFFAR
jgi:NADH:ubiquinone oxidoreductase subunit 5 (subunit L)/multisubunit Na+/H+ antiporter MnhA subunit